MLNRELLQLNGELEQALEDRDGELIRARNGLVLALAKLVEHRSAETGSHLVRLQRYCRVLAEEAAATPAFAALLDATLHPHAGRLRPAARHRQGRAARPHPEQARPARRQRAARDADAHDHRRRHAPRGRPPAPVRHRLPAHGHRHRPQPPRALGRHRLPGPARRREHPAGARVLAMADVYDALRSKRVYKPGLSHTTAVMTMTEGSPGQFDPALLEVFRKSADQFDRIFREFTD